jgi:hypothetical protein
VKRRAAALLAAATVVALLGVGGGTLAGAATTKPKISLSTSDFAPGQRVFITGSGWPVDSNLSLVLCGADAVSGTADCAETTTVSVIAPRTGRLYVWMTTAVPPKPCPCVILVTGVTDYYTQKIPVTVVGVPTAPVPPAAPPVEPEFRVTLQLVGGTTLASSFGAAAPRTLDVRVDNLGTRTETPLLLGRWGTGKRYTNVIKMPTMRSLGSGQSQVVQAHFSLPALSMGLYTVKVFVEGVGFRVVASDSGSTSTWPIALFVTCLVALELILMGIVKVVRNRRRRRAAEEGAGRQPEYPDGLTALGAKVGAAAPSGHMLAQEGHDPRDPAPQLE